MNKHLVDLRVVVTKEVNSRIKAGKVLNPRGKLITKQVSERDVENVAKAIGLAIRKGSDNMENINIPYFGAFRVYEGRKSVIGNEEFLKKLGIDKEKMKEILKVKAKEVAQNGIKLSKHKSFRLVK